MSVVGRQLRIDFCVKALPPSKSYGLPFGRRQKIPGRKALLRARPPKIENFDPAKALQFTQPEVDWRMYNPLYTSSSAFVKMTPDEFLNLCKDFTVAGTDSFGRSKYNRELQRVSLVRENMKRLNKDEKKIFKDKGGTMQLIVEEISAKHLDWVKNVVNVDYVPKPAGKRLFLVTKHYGRHRALVLKTQDETVLGVKVTIIGKQQQSPPERIAVGDYLLREPSNKEQKQKQYTPNYLLKIKPSSI